MKTAWKFYLTVVCVLAVGIGVLFLDFSSDYRVEPDLSNLEELTNQWLSRGDKVETNHQLRLYEPVKLGGLIYVPMEVGIDQQTGYVRLEKGLNGKYKIHSTSHGTADIRTGVLEEGGEKYLLFQGRNGLGQIASARFHWDGRYEYEDAIPPEGYAYELEIPEQAVFLVCTRVDDNIPAGPLLLDSLTLYDAQGQDITDDLVRGIGRIQ